MNNKENSAANDVFGSFGSDLRTKEFIQKGRFEATAKGFYNPFGGYVGMIEGGGGGGGGGAQVSVWEERVQRV